MSLEKLPKDMVKYLATFAHPIVVKLFREYYFVPFGSIDKITEYLFKTVNIKNMVINKIFGEYQSNFSDDFIDIAITKHFKKLLSVEKIIDSKTEEIIINVHNWAFTDVDNVVFLFNNHEGVPLNKKLEIAKNIIIKTIDFDSDEFKKFIVQSIKFIKPRPFIEK